MYNGLEYKMLKDIKLGQEKIQLELMELDKKKLHLLTNLMELEAKRLELEEYIRERGE